MIEDSLPYLVNYFGCINGSRNVYMNFALFFAQSACWYVKNGIKSFEAVFCHHLLTYILLFSVPLLHITKSATIRNLNYSVKNSFGLALENISLLFSVPWY